PASFSRATQMRAGTALESRSPGSWFLRYPVVVVHVLPAQVFAGLPGLSLEFPLRPRAVIVFVLFQLLVFLGPQQDEGFFRLRIYEARRNRFAVMQCLD